MIPSNNYTEQVSTTMDSTKREPSGLILKTGRVRLPDKLMEYLNKEVAPEALYWMPGGESFALDTEKVQEQILDRYFNGTKLTSFLRSISRWGFRRVFFHTLDKHVYSFHHELFQKDSPELEKDMKMACTAPSKSKTAKKAVASQDSREQPAPLVFSAPTTGLASPRMGSPRMGSPGVASPSVSSPILNPAVVDSQAKQYILQNLAALRQHDGSMADLLRLAVNQSSVNQSSVGGFNSHHQSPTTQHRQFVSPALNQFPLTGMDEPGLRLLQQALARQHAATRLEEQQRNLMNFVASLPNIKRP